MEGEEGAGMASLGLGRSEVDGVVEEDELREEGPGLKVAGEESLSSGADMFPVGDGSMAENTSGKSIKTL